MRAVTSPVAIRSGRVRGNAAALVDDIAAVRLAIEELKGRITW